MMTALARLLLGPLLLLQGAHVRRATPRLPEASGERAGVSGEGRPLRLLVAGDSAAAGVGAAHQGEALAGQLVARLSGACRVSWKLMARTGYTTGRLLAMLEQGADERFDVALISVGVNDVTSRAGADEWVAALERLLALLRQKYGVAHILISQVPPMHAFPALPRPLRGYLGARARHFNHRLRELALQDRGFTVLAPELPLDAALMASDGFHPGPALYALWAEAAARQIQPSLQRTP